MEKITPAISKHQICTYLNDSEFQTLLVSFLEDKGIICDIRSHICYKMVNVLKNTAVGKQIFRMFSQNMSLSKQAVNILVAEYLLKNNYEYTLTIFNAEASLTNILPEYTSTNMTGNKFNNFDSKNVLHILDLIGFPDNCKARKEILKIYYQEPRDMSMLNCLIAILSKIKDEQLNEEEQSSGKNVFISRIIIIYFLFT